MPWGGTWTWLTVPVTGLPMFDFFFTLVLVFGLLAWTAGLIFHLLTRS